MAYKVFCHVCSWDRYAGTMAEAKHFQRHHEHIDTEVKRVS